MRGLSTVRPSGRVLCPRDLAREPSRQGRVYQAVSRIVECSPLLNDADIMRDRVTFPSFGNATITAIASDAAGAAGHNACFSTFDELWGYTSERSRRLWDEMSTSPVRARFPGG
jgi:hypothetical protein